MTVLLNVLKLLAVLIAIPTIIYPDMVHDHFLRLLALAVVSILADELTRKYYKKPFWKAILKK